MQKVGIDIQSKYGKKDHDEHLCGDQTVFLFPLNKL